MKKGFTLLELLIATAISSIVALGVFSIFSSHPSILYETHPEREPAMLFPHFLQLIRGVSPDLIYLLTYPAVPVWNNVSKEYWHIM